MATKKDKTQFSAWIDPTVAEQPTEVHNKYRKLFPKQGGLAKAVEMIIEAGSKVVSDVCEKELKKQNQKNND